MMTSPDDVPVVGDAGYIRQVLMNLCSNAIKFSYEGSTVQLNVKVVPKPPIPAAAATSDTNHPPAHRTTTSATSTHAANMTNLSNTVNATFSNTATTTTSSSPNSSTLFSAFAPDATVNPPLVQLTFEVVDSGRGISQDFLPQLFTPFAQEYNKTKLVVDSTGLGLLICKRLVDAMEGTIQVESEVGKGSKFTVCLLLERTIRPQHMQMRSSSSSAAEQAPSSHALLGMGGLLGNKSFMHSQHQYHPYHQQQQMLFSAGAGMLPYDSYDSDKSLVGVVSHPESLFRRNLERYVTSWPETKFGQLYSWDVREANNNEVVAEILVSRFADKLISDIKDHGRRLDVLLVDHDFLVLQVLYRKLSQELSSKQQMPALIYFTSISNHGYHHRQIEAMQKKNANQNRSLLNIDGSINPATMTTKTTVSSAPLEVILLLHPACCGKIYRAVLKAIKTVEENRYDNLLTPTAEYSGFYLPPSSTLTPTTQPSQPPQPPLVAGVERWESLKLVRSSSANRKIIPVTETPDEPSSVFPFPVLVVEDNALNLKIITTFLSRKKIVFDVAENGQIALDLVTKRMDDAFTQWEEAATVATHLLPFRLILMVFLLVFVAAVNVSSPISSTIYPISRISRISPISRTSPHLTYEGRANAGDGRFREHQAHPRTRDPVEGTLREAPRAVRRCSPRWYLLHDRGHDRPRWSGGRSLCGEIMI